MKTSTTYCPSWKLVLAGVFIWIAGISFVKADPYPDTSYYQRWIRSIELSLTQPDFNPSKRKLRKMLYRIRKGTYNGEPC